MPIITEVAATVSDVFVPVTPTRSPTVMSANDGDVTFGSR
jgi:hypothetical protein